MFTFKILGYLIRDAIHEKIISGRVLRKKKKNEL